MSNTIVSIASVGLLAMLTRREKHQLNLKRLRFAIVFSLVTVQKRDATNKNASLANDP